MADSNTVSTDDGTIYATTIGGGLQGTVDTVSNPSIPAPALGMAAEIEAATARLQAEANKGVALPLGTRYRQSR